jgi:hypothetical protein
MSHFELELGAILNLINQKRTIELNASDLDEKDKEATLPKKEVVPVKPKRCQHSDCKIKLILSDFPCRCKNFYCAQHRLSEAHKCSFDYKAFGKETLKKELPTVVADKLNRL